MKRTIDRVRLGPQVDGVRQVVRNRGVEGEYEVGTFHEIQEGTPMSPGEELVNVGKEDADGWRNVEVIYRNGPAQVSTPAYRKGYDRIFGKKSGVGLA